jgi:hypothetical protein
MNQPEALPTGESEPPVIAQCLCSTCGAVCEVGAEQCWMCFQAGSPARTTINPYSASQIEYLPYQQWQPPSQSKYEGIFQFLLLMCVLLAVLVSIGLWVQDPGLLVGFLILVGPAFAVTGVRALWQVGKQGKASPKSLFLSLVISFAFTVAILVTLVAAGVILLIAMCFHEISRV